MADGYNNASQWERAAQIIRSRESVPGFNPDLIGPRITKQNKHKVARDFARKIALEGGENSIKPRIMVYDQAGNVHPWEKGAMAALNMDELSPGRGYQGTWDHWFNSKAAGFELRDERIDPATGKQKDGAFYTNEALDKLATNELRKMREQYPDQEIDFTDFRNEVRAYALANHYVQPWVEQLQSTIGANVGTEGMFISNHTEGHIEEEDLAALLSTMPKTEHRRFLRALSDVVQEAKKTYKSKTVATAEEVVKGTATLGALPLTIADALAHEKPSGQEDYGKETLEMAKAILGGARVEGMEDAGTSVIGHVGKNLDDTVAPALVHIGSMMVGGQAAGTGTAKVAGFLNKVIRGKTLAAGVQKGATTAQKIAAINSRKNMLKSVESAGKIGSVGYWTAAEYVPMQKELMEMGMDPTTAALTALPASIVIALVERQQLLQTTKLADEAHSGLVKALHESRKGYLKRRWDDVVDIGRKMPRAVAVQTAEEMVQWGIGETTKYLAGLAEGVEYDKTTKEVGDEFVKELIGSGGALSFLSAGMGIRGRVGVRRGEKQLMREFMEKRAAEIEVGEVWADSYIQDLEDTLLSQEHIAPEDAAEMLGISEQQLDDLRDQGILDYETDVNAAIAAENLKEAKRKLAQAGDNIIDQEVAMEEIAAAQAEIENASITYRREDIYNLATQEGIEISPEYDLDLGDVESILDWLENPSTTHSGMAGVTMSDFDVLMPDGTTKTFNLPISRLLDTPTARRAFRKRLLDSERNPSIYKAFGERLVNLELKEKQAEQFREKMQPVVDVFMKHVDRDGTLVNEFLQLLEGEPTRSQFNKFLLARNAFNDDGSLNMETPEAQLLSELMEAMGTGMVQQWSDDYLRKLGVESVINYQGGGEFMPPHQLMTMDDQNFRGWVLANGGSDGMISTMSREGIINRLLGQTSQRLVATQKKFLVPTNLEKLGINSQDQRNTFLEMLSDGMNQHARNEALKDIKMQVLSMAQLKREGLLDDVAGTLIDLEERMKLAKTSEERINIDADIKTLFDQLNRIAERPLDSQFRTIRLDKSGEPIVLQISEDIGTMPWENYIKIKQAKGEEIPDFLSNELQRMYLRKKFTGEQVPDWLDAQFNPDSAVPDVTPAPVKRYPISEAWIERVIDRVQAHLDSPEARYLTAAQEDELYEYMYTARRGADPDDVLWAQEHLTDFVSKLEKGEKYLPKYRDEWDSTPGEMKRARRMGENFKRLIKDGILEDPDAWSAQMLKYLKLTPEQVQRAVLGYRQRVNSGEVVTDNMLAEVMYQAVTGNGINLDAEVIEQAPKPAPEEPDFLTGREQRLKIITSLEGKNWESIIEQEFPGRNILDLDTAQLQQLGNILDSYKDAISEELESRGLTFEKIKELREKGKKRTAQEKKDYKFANRMEKLFDRITPDPFVLRDEYSPNWRLKDDPDYVPPNHPKHFEGKGLKGGRVRPEIGIIVNGERVNVHHLEDGYDLDHDIELRSPTRVKTYHAIDLSDPNAPIRTFDVYHGYLPTGKMEGDAAVRVYERGQSKPIDLELMDSNMQSFAKAVQSSANVIYERMGLTFVGASSTVTPQFRGGRAGVKNRAVRKKYMQLRGKMPKEIRHHIDSWVANNTNDDGIKLALIQYLHDNYYQREYEDHDEPQSWEDVYITLKNDEEYLGGREFKDYRLVRIAVPDSDVRFNWQVYYKDQPQGDLVRSGWASAKSLIWRHWRENERQNYHYKPDFLKEMNDMLKEGSHFMRQHKSMFTWSQEEKTGRLKFFAAKALGKIQSQKAFDAHAAAAHAHTPRRYINKLIMRPMANLTIIDKGDSNNDGENNIPKDPDVSPTLVADEWSKKTGDERRADMEVGVELGISQLIASNVIDGRDDVLNSTISASTDGGQAVVTLKDGRHLVVDKTMYGRHGDDAFWFTVNTGLKKGASDEDNYIGSATLAGYNLPSDWWAATKEFLNDIDSDKFMHDDDGNPLSEKNFEKIHLKIVQRLHEEGYSEYISDEVKAYYASELGESQSQVNNVGALTPEEHSRKFNDIEMDQITAMMDDLILEQIKNEEIAENEDDIKDMFDIGFNDLLESWAMEIGLSTEEYLRTFPEKEDALISTVIDLYHGSYKERYDFSVEQDFESPQEEAEPVDQDEVDAYQVEFNNPENHDLLKLAFEQDDRYRDPKNYYEYGDILYLRTRTGSFKDGTITVGDKMHRNVYVTAPAVLELDVPFSEGGVFVNPQNDNNYALGIVKNVHGVPQETRLYEHRGIGSHKILGWANVYASAGNELSVLWGEYVGRSDSSVSVDVSTVTVENLIDFWKKVPDSWKKRIEEGIEEAYRYSHTMIQYRDDAVRGLDNMKNALPMALTFNRNQKFDRLEIEHKVFSSDIADIKEALEKEKANPGQEAEAEIDAVESEVTNVEEPTPDTPDIPEDFEVEADKPPEKRKKLKNRKLKKHQIRKVNAQKKKEQDLHQRRITVTDIEGPFYEMFLDELDSRDMDEEWFNSGALQDNPDLYNSVTDAVIAKAESKGMEVKPWDEVLRERAARHGQGEMESEIDEDIDDGPMTQQSLFSLESQGMQIIDEDGNAIDLSQYETEESQQEGEQFTHLEWTNLPGTDKDIDPRAAEDYIPGLKYIGFSEALGAFEYELGGETVWIKHVKFIPYKTGDVEGYGRMEEYDQAREDTGVSATGGMFLNMRLAGGDQVILISDLGMDVSPGGRKTLIHEISHMLQMGGRFDEKMQDFILQTAIEQGRMTGNERWDMIVEATADVLTDAFNQETRQRSKSGILRKFRNLVRRLGLMWNRVLVNSGHREMNLDYIIDQWFSGKLASEKKSREQSYLTRLRTVPSRHSRNFYDIIGQASEEVKNARGERQRAKAQGLIRNSKEKIKSIQWADNFIGRPIQWGKGIRHLFNTAIRSHNIDDPVQRNRLTRLTEQKEGFLQQVDDRMQRNFNAMRSIRSKIGVDKLPPAIKEALFEALTDPFARDDLAKKLAKEIKDPKELQKVEELFQEYMKRLDDARNHIDELSKLLLQYVPGIDEEMKLEIDRNINVYVTRAYALFNSQDYVDMIRYSERGRELMERAAEVVLEEDNKSMEEAAKNKAIRDVIGNPNTQISKDYRAYRAQVRKELAAGQHANVVSNFGGDTKLALKFLAAQWKNRWANSPAGRKVWESDFNATKRDITEARDIVQRIINDHTKKGVVESEDNSMLDRGILMQRKELDEVFRELYGEIRDPETGYAITVNKMGSLISTAIFQNEILLDSVFSDQISENSSETHQFSFSGDKWGVLSESGYFFTEELYEAIQNAFNKTVVGHWKSRGNPFDVGLALLSQASQTTKTMLTVANPRAQSRNPLDATYHALVNGWFSYDSLRKAYIISLHQTKRQHSSKIQLLTAAPVHLLGLAVRAVDWKKRGAKGGIGKNWAEFKRSFFDEFDENNKDLYELGDMLLREGVLSNDQWKINEKEMQELSASKWDQGFKGRQRKKAENMSGKAIAKAAGRYSDRLFTSITDNKVMNSLKALYRMPDDMVKIMGYLKEREHEIRARKLGENKSDSQIRAEMLGIQETAINNVLEMTTTYSRIGRLPKALGSTPFVGSFASWQSSFYRATIGKYLTIAKELKSDNPVRKKRGLTRLASGLAADIGMSVILRSLLPMMMFDDEEEVEAYLELLPEWQKDHTMVVLKWGDEGPEFIDLSMVMPHLVFGDIVSAGYRHTKRHGIGDGLMAAVFEGLDPYLDEDVYLSKLVDVIPFFGRGGQPKYSKKVYDSLDSTFHKMKNSLDHITLGLRSGARGPLVPGFVTESQRFMEAMKGEETRTGVKRSMLGASMRWIAGVEMTSIDAQRKLTLKASEFRSKLKVIKDDLRRSGFSENSDTFRRKMMKFRNDNAMLYDEMGRVVYAARKLGLSLDDIQGTLRTWNVPKDDIQAFINRSDRKPVFSDKTIEGMLDSATSPEEREVKSEILSEYTDEQK